MFRYSKYLLFC